MNAIRKERHYDEDVGCNLVGFRVQPEDAIHHGDINCSKNSLRQGNVLPMIRDVIETTEDIDKSSGINQRACVALQLWIILKNENNDRCETINQSSNQLTGTEARIDQSIERSTGKRIWPARTQRGIQTLKHRTKVPLRNPSTSCI